MLCWGHIHGSVKSGPIRPAMCPRVLTRRAKRPRAGMSSLGDNPTAGKKPDEYEAYVTVGLHTMVETLDESGQKRT